MMTTMMITRFFFLFLMMMGMTYGIVAQNGPHDSHYQAPSDWHVSLSDNELHLYHQEHGVTLAVLVTVFDHPVTANGIHVSRMTSHYDGWINVGEESGTHFDNQRANVAESFKAIYAKTNVNDQLEETRQLVIEYYYVKNNKSYIISIQTRESYWPYLKPDIQFFLNHFWIGPDPRSWTRIQENPYTWPMLGKTANNANMFPLSNPLTDTLHSNWEVTYNGTALVHPPIITDTWYAFVSHQTLVLGDRETGQINWEMTLTAPLIGTLASDKNVLLFVIDTVPPTLMGILPDTQQIMLKKPLVNTQGVSGMVIADHSVFIHLSDRLEQIDYQNGRTLWRYPLKPNLSIAPVVYKNTVLSVDQNGTVNHVNWKTKQPIGHYAIEPVISPIIQNNTLFLTSKPNENTLMVTAIDLKTNAILWQSKKQTAAITQLWPAAMTGSHYGLLFQDETGMNYLWSLASQTGKESVFNLVEHPIKSRALIGSPNTFQFLFYHKNKPWLQTVQLEPHTITAIPIDPHLNPITIIDHYVYGRSAHHLVLMSQPDILHIRSIK